jgi:dipeptidyl aminopeptidase/acylaminoacyl peptidase
MPATAPCGTWKSPVTADLIVAESIGLAGLAADGDDIYWLEMRPSENGRYVLVRRTPDGSTTDLTPPPFNVRSRVHEYGGGSFLVSGGRIWTVHFDDQRIYEIRSDDGAVPLTANDGRRYADFIHDPARDRLIAVHEDAGGGAEPSNTLVAIALSDGSVTTLFSGTDFVSSPRLSPDGGRLAWLSWNHPNMPWDGTTLWVAGVRPDGTLDDPVNVAGGVAESIFQPEWAPDGTLYFISDRNGWWNIYKDGDGAVTPVLEMAAEFGMPQWGFGMSTYGVGSDGQLMVSYSRDGIRHLGRLDPRTGALDEIRTPFTDIEMVRPCGNGAAFLGAAADRPRSVVRLDAGTGESEVLKVSFSAEIDGGYISIPSPVCFPTDGGETAHGIFYHPKNRDFSPPIGELPPLLVFTHGGPTAAATSAFSPTIQFWTSRGIAVLDVNYGGSTGYGRAYRERLRERWGIVDVADCENGARYLASRGDVDADRLAIRGGSAGGFTTLAALVFRDTFRAGASYFGVSDLEALAQETHKFESRYLDGLIGPYPERRDRYLDRSPIHAVDRLSCPIIFFQGTEDRIVPPNQAEAMVAALREKGIPVAYLAFDGEQHGFRRAKNIKRALEAELFFYGRIFGFTPADVIEPVEIENT